MVVQFYSRALARFPILTQCVATGVLFAAGDVIAQQGVERRGIRGHKWERTARLSAFGMCIAGPALSHWYRFLERTVTLKQPFANLSGRVALDQFAFSPVSVATFFTANGLMEGLSGDEIRAKLDATYWLALTNNWKVWIGVQYLNFALVPVHHRLLVVNTVALGWNTYMSTLNSSAAEGAVASDHAEAGRIVEVTANDRELDRPDQIQAAAAAGALLPTHASA